MLDFKKLKSHWFEFFHTIYATIVITTATGALYTQKTGGDSADFTTSLLLIFFLVYFVILLLFLILFTFKYSRKARYSEATKCVHNALHISRNAYHYLDWCNSPVKDSVHFDNERFNKYMTDALSSACMAFTLVTGVRCRTSIKVIGQTADQQLYVTTLARDTVSSNECAHKDRNESPEKHLILSNTDFHLIMQDMLPYFFSNDLPNYPNYSNTSINDYAPSKGSKWTLPYKSTIVFPIRYVWTKEEVSNFAVDNEKNNKDIYGFLTVDCSSKEVFESYDVDMGAALADALFPIFNAYVKFKS